MGALTALFVMAQFALREIALFAAVGFVVLGASDRAVDLIWMAIALARRVRRKPHLTFADLPAPVRPGLIVVFIPAWQEAAVIGAMLRHALAAFEHDDYRIYVGCYPNDPATADAVHAIGDARIRTVIGPNHGPTTKADCLNTLWAALREDEAVEGRLAKAVVLHDAEDVVHSAELRVFDAMIEHHDLVQLPVEPLIDKASRWVGGHYADEFAEAHGKEMIVRAGLGAALPSAGVGCAISRAALAELAIGEGQPFDPCSLTEDYEIGLRLRALGRTSTFVRIAAPGGRVICTKEYFPGTIRAAVNQKARWMTGIAFSGWDRLGWSGGLAERWMRLRDRQAPLAAILMTAAYVALFIGALVTVLGYALDRAPAPLSSDLQLLLMINTVLLAWRLAMRFGFVTATYGWREGLRAIPRLVTANAIAILAARKAVARYLTIRRTGRPVWSKTDHRFPAEVPAE